MPSRQLIQHYLLRTVLLFGCLSPLSNAGAQEDSKEEVDSTKEVEVIMVTARRTPEKLSSVPSSIGLVSPADTIENYTDGAIEIGRRIANYAVNDVGNPRQGFGALRGVGTIGFPLNPFDTTIAYAKNGHPLSLFSGFHQLLDIERIEVLRGPQNVLYGRSSQGGTVNYVTRVPDGLFEGKISGEFAEDGEYLGEATIGGAIIDDKVNGRATIRFLGGDGFINNISTGETLPVRRIGAGRAALRFIVDDATTVDVTAMLENDRRNTTNIFINRNSPEFPASGVSPSTLFNRELTILTIDLEKELEGFNFAADFGYQDIDIFTNADATDSLLFSPITGFPPSFFDTVGTDFIEADQNEEVFSGELRFSSVSDASLRWIAGISGYVSDFDAPNVQASQFNPSANGTSLAFLELNDFSAFAEVSIDISDQLTITPGIRVGKVSVDRDDVFTTNGFPGIVDEFTDSGEFEDNYVSGGVTLDYAYDKSTLLYASVKSGFAGGGFVDFNANVVFGIPLESFPSSDSWTYEAGFRHFFFDNQSNVSASIFYNDVEKGHVQAFDIVNAIFIVEPLDYQTYGFDIELDATLGDYTSLFAFVGFTDSEFVDPPLNAGSGAIDGAALPNVSRWNSGTGISHSIPMSSVNLPGELTGELEIQYQGSRPADVAGSFNLPSFTIINARVSWEFDDYLVYVFGRNLTNEIVQASGASFGPGIEGVAVGSTDRIIGAGFQVSF